MMRTKLGNTTCKLCRNSFESFMDLRKKVGRGNGYKKYLMHLQKYSLNIRNCSFLYQCREVEIKIGNGFLSHASK